MKEVMHYILDTVCTLGMSVSILGLASACEQPGVVKLIVWFAVFALFAAPVVIKSARGAYQDNADT